MNLAYDDRGTGDPVLFIAGRGGAGRTWHLHQVPEFLTAGYRTITFDNRGIGATENADGFGTEQMVADTAALIEKLDVAPVRIVAVSMGAFIAQELMLARPELVSQAVLMATRGRQDRARDFFRTAERELAESGVALPRVLRRESSAAGELFTEDAERRHAPCATGSTCSPCGRPSRRPGCARQLGIGPRATGCPLTEVLRPPTLVIGFADDVVLPPHLGREVADAIPNGRYLEIPDAGHLGFIEKPQDVNAAALDFFADVNAVVVNPSTAQARVVVDELIRGGVRDVVLCPGSRNAPLAFALQDADRAGRIRLHVRIDERTAGYLAIGLAVAAGAPVCVAMTSGTAVANLGPAVVEANYARVPLIVLSANRPYELLGTGANQTMEQLGYFGTQVRASISLGLAEDAPERMDALNAQWRSATCRVLVAAKGSRSANAGPVQFDIPLREPLVPDPEHTGGRLFTRRAAPAASRGPTPRRSRSTSRCDIDLTPDTVVIAGHGAGVHPNLAALADGRRADRAACAGTAAPARVAAAAPAAGDHARPPDAAPAGVGAAGRPVGAGLRADHRAALARRVRQLAGHRHPRSHQR